MREKLSSVFEVVDEDGGGSVSMDEADKLFFVLGVNLNDEEIMAITTRCGPTPCAAGPSAAILNRQPSTVNLQQ